MRVTKKTKNTITIENIGCEELLLTRTKDYLRIFWWPKTGAVRYWGSSDIVAHCRNRRELVRFARSQP